MKSKENGTPRDAYKSHFWTAYDRPRGFSALDQIHYLPRSPGKRLPQQSHTELNILPISLEPRRASCMARRRHPLQLQTGQKFQKTATFSTAGPSTPIGVTKGVVEYNSR